VPERPKRPRCAGLCAPCTVQHLAEALVRSLESRLGEGRRATHLLVHELLRAAADDLKRRYEALVRALRGCGVLAGLDETRRGRDARDEAVAGSGEGRGCCGRIRVVLEGGLRAAASALSGCKEGGRRGGASGADGERAAGSQGSALVGCEAESSGFAGKATQQGTERQGTALQQRKQARLDARPSLSRDPGIGEVAYDRQVVPLEDVGVVVRSQAVREDEKESVSASEGERERRERDAPHEAEDDEVAEEEEVLQPPAEELTDKVQQDEAEAEEDRLRGEEGDESVSRRTGTTRTTDAPATRGT